MSEPFRTRTATRADLPTLRGLIEAFRDHLGETEPASASLDGSLERVLADPDTEFVLAFGNGDAPLGYAQLRFRYSLWFAGIEAHVEDFFVTAAARRRGVGTHLLRASVERARVRGVRQIGLTTNERNEPAQRLYEAAGFRAENARWDGGRQLWFQRPSGDGLE